jgi:transcriptional regulator with XRE-family HTH domain
VTLRGASRPPSGNRATTHAPLARLLLEYRFRADLSQATLASQAGVTQTYLSGLERGKRQTPSRALVEALARALALSPYQRRCLLVAAGYTPVAEWAPTLEAIYLRRAELPDPHAFDLAILTHVLDGDAFPPEPPEEGEFAPSPTARAPDLAPEGQKPGGARQRSEPVRGDAASDG